VLGECKERLIYSKLCTTRIRYQGRSATLVMWSRSRGVRHNPIQV
jgi:hypothetical protein